MQKKYLVGLSVYKDTSNDIDDHYEFYTVTCEIVEFNEEINEETIDALEEKAGKQVNKRFRGCCKFYILSFSLLSN